MEEEILALEEAFDSLLLAKDLDNTISFETVLSVASKWCDAVWKNAEKSGTLSFTEKEIQEALRLSKKAVFICGVHRSGTTLLRDLLDDHPSLSVLPAEGSFITNLEQQLQLLPANIRCSFMCKEWLRRLANPIDQPPYWVLGRSSQKQMLYIYFARAFITWWNFFANDSGTESNMWPLVVVQLAYAFVRNRHGEYSTLNFWVDKTPANERNLTRLWQQFPEAKIIHVIRDPIHVLTSRKQLEPCSPLRIFIRDLRMSLKVAAKQQNKKDGRYLLIRYEDLCSDPSATTQHLASFLGIQSLPCLLNPTVAGKPAKANSSFQLNSEYGRVLNAEEHKQENILTGTELKLLSAAIGNTALKFGYTLPSVGALKTFVLKSIYRIW